MDSYHVCWLGQDIEGVKWKMVGFSYLSIQLRLEGFLLLSAVSNNSVAVILEL